MGVLACDKAGCEAIMVAHDSLTYGYLCYNCLDDLIVEGPVDIQQWMDTPLRHRPTYDSWAELVRYEFKMRD